MSCDPVPARPVPARPVLDWRRAAPMRRRLSAAVVLAALLLPAACTPPTSPGWSYGAALAGHGERPAAPRFTDAAYITPDGAALPLHKWLPKGEVKAVILALHGFNDYGNAFAIPAKLWAERGIATYAIDQRGFGGAPLRKSWAGTEVLAADAATATRALRQLYPGRPLYLLGESMGGAVAILAMTGIDRTPTADVDGVILSAPAVWARPTMDLLPRLALWASARLFPELTVTGRDLGIKPSDNIPMLRALSKDPMVLKETRVATVYGLVDLMDEALAAAPRLQAPLLVLYGAHDEIVPREPVAAFAAALPAEAAPRRRLAYYPRGYHLLLRDLQGPVVAGDVASWVFDPKAPLPSEADRVATASPWPPLGERNGRADRGGKVGG